MASEAGAGEGSERWLNFVVIAVVLVIMILNVSVTGMPVRNVSYATPVVTATRMIRDERQQ